MRCLGVMTAAVVVALALSGNAFASQLVDRNAGVGARYRLVALGPGVEPNVETDIGGLHPYDRNNASDVSYEQQQVAILKSLADKRCLPGH